MLLHGKVAHIEIIPIWVAHFDRLIINEDKSCTCWTLMGSLARVETSSGMTNLRWMFLWPRVEFALRPHVNSSLSPVKPHHASATSITARLPRCQTTSCQCYKHNVAASMVSDHIMSVLQAQWHGFHGVRPHHSSATSITARLPRCQTTSFQCYKHNGTASTVSDHIMPVLQA